MSDDDADTSLQFGSNLNVNGNAQVKDSGRIRAISTTDDEEELDEAKQVGKLAKSSTADFNALVQKKTVTISESSPKIQSIVIGDDNVDGGKSNGNGIGNGNSESEVQLFLPLSQSQPTERTGVDDCELDRTPTKELDMETNLAVWKMNYREAAIYLTEGERNDPFSAHPSNRSKLHYYFITHNVVYNVVTLVVSLLNMALALVEGPGKPVFYCPFEVRLSVELFCLAVFTSELAVRYQWMGKQNYLRHGRTLLKTAFIIALLIEVIVYYSCGMQTGRYVRIIRPLFVIDNYYSGGQRRFIRQVFGSLGPVFNMVLLLLFNMTLFALLGYYLFCQIPNNHFFVSLRASFVSLFVLLTTANFPDVMMPAYAHNQAAVIFFIVYLCIELYLLMNLVFAVVYNKFSESQVEKLKKMYVHRQKAAELAFDLLTTKANPGFVTYHHFEGMMRYYKPKLSRLWIYLTFKALDDNGGGQISLKEFCHVYEASRYKWDIEKDCLPWWHKLHGKQKKLMLFLFHVVESRIFVFITYAIIIGNTVLIIFDAANNKVVQNKVQDLEFNAAELIFAILYGVEAALKILAIGPSAYFRIPWNVFDFTVTALILLGQIVNSVTANFPYSIFLRPFRLIRLLKVKKLYREVLSTTFTLSNRFGSVLAVVAEVYYFYGIIGINIFGEIQMVNCCNGSIASYYQNGTDYYYLNNFENILNSAVTLFELTIVNNWYVIMEAYCQVTSEWARVFFMLFYLNMMILVNMVLSFILGAFMFRMQYKQHNVGDTIEDRAWVYEHTELNSLEKSIFSTPFDVALKRKPLKRLRKFIRKKRTEGHKSASEHESGTVLRRLDAVDFGDDTEKQQADVELGQLAHVTLDDTGVSHKYKGTRKKMQFEFNLEMNETELKSWLNEEKFVASLKCAMRRKTNSASLTPNFQKRTPPWARRSFWHSLPTRVGLFLWNKALWLLELDKQEVQSLGNVQQLTSVPQTAEVWHDEQPRFPRVSTTDSLAPVQQKQAVALLAEPKSILKRDSSDGNQAAQDTTEALDTPAPVRRLANLFSSRPEVAPENSDNDSLKKQPKLALVLAQVVDKMEREKDPAARTLMKQNSTSAD